MMTLSHFGKFLNGLLGWHEMQWVAILMPCLVGPAQQAVKTLAAEEVLDYGKVKEAIFQTLNLSPEAFWRRLTAVVFSPGYHPRLTVQTIWAGGLWWL